MYIHIFLLSVILFVVFCIVWKNELIKSLFYTVCFIIVLWINIPCFVKLSDLEKSDSLTLILFRLKNDFDIFYVICVNILVGIMLYFQSKFTNKIEYSHAEIKRMYDKFGCDAVQLYIIGKDLDFLDKKKYRKQTNRILHLKNNCKLLCEATTDEELLEMYKEVSKQGVEINFYTENDNIINLKGQIKIDQSGMKKAMFTPKVNKKYRLLDIDNQFLVSTILERCFQVYKKADV